MKRPAPCHAFAVLIAGLAGGNILACEPSGDQLIGLQVTPGEFAGPAGTLDVKLFENACVQVQRPAHFRRPGGHRLELVADERNAFDAWRSQPALRDFDAATMLARVADLQQDRATDGNRELFEVLDADRYVLTLRDGAGTRELHFNAVFQYAEHYPEIAQLRAMAELVEKLQRLAEDPRLVQVEVSKPSGEVLP